MNEIVNMRESNNKSDIGTQLNLMALEWYKDENGCDPYYFGTLSIGHLIGSAAIVFFTAIYREYYEIESMLEDGKHVVLNEKEHPIRLLVQRMFGGRIEINNSAPLCYEIPLRQHNVVPGFNRFGRILAYVQRSFQLFLKKGQDLYLSDWTYRELEAKTTNSRFVNSKRIWKGAYLRTPAASYLQKAEGYLPLVLNEFEIYERLHSYNFRNEVGLSEDILELFRDYIILYYNQNRSFFVQTLALYEDMLDRYSPKSVFFPGELYEPYILIRSLCERKKIKTVFMLDGFSLFSYYPNLRNSSGTNYIFDEYVAFGNAQIKEFRSRGVKNKDISSRKWPVFYKYDRLKKDLRYDCIIMSWIPYINNIKADFSSRANTLNDVINLAVQKGYKRIAIKMKGESERKYISDLLQENQWQIDLLEGPLYQHIGKAAMLIGGISSAVAEATYCNIPYFIYEPPINGYADEMIYNSEVLTPQVVARNIEELAYNIDKGKSLLAVDRSYINGIV